MASLRLFLACIVLLLAVSCSCAAGDPGARAASAIAQEDWEGVLAVTGEGLAGEPDNISLLCMEGYALRKLGRYPEAVAAVSRAIAFDPEPVRYANRGYAHLAMGDYSAALADAEAALLIDSADATSWAVKAMALAGLLDLTGAGPAIDRALALSPESAHYWHVRGEILLAAGNTTGAAAALNHSIEIDPGYSLPWPGMPAAQEELAAAIQAATPAQATPNGGAVAVAGFLVVLVWPLRRR